MTYTFKLAKRLAHSRALHRGAWPAALLLLPLAGACTPSPYAETGTPSDPSAAIASVTLTPDSLVEDIGQTGRFTAVVRDTAGQVVAGAVQWTSSDTTVVRVDQDGATTALAAGTATITATFTKKTSIKGHGRIKVRGSAGGGPASVASVSVSPATTSVVAGLAQQYAATLRDSAGNILTGRTVTWTASDTTVTTIDATGLAATIKAGTATITAVSGGKSGSAALTVTAPAPVSVASVTVGPATASILAGATQQFSATLRDSAGNVLTGRTITWSSGSTGVATVNGSGLATGVAAGSATITATSGGKSASAALTVTAPAPVSVASVTVSPATVSLTTGGTQQLTATVKDSAGNVLTGRTITWASGNTGVATVSGSGLVTAVAAGSASVTATAGGKSGSSAVGVSAPPPPPSGTPWANEPAGYSLITDNAFNALTTSDGWNITWNTNGYASIVADATAPLSPSNVLEMRYPSGFAGGSGPANDYHTLPNLKRLYAGFWWKASTPWQGHSSNVNKILFIFPSSGGDIYIAMYGPPGGPYQLRVLPQFSGFPSNWLVPNVNNPNVTIGTWHKIEWVLQYSTSGQSDGVIQWWMDGQLVGDYHNVPFPDGGMTEFKINPTWGGAGDTKTENDYFRYDHIHLSGN